MKVNPIIHNTNASKILKKGTAMAAGVVLGVAALSVYNNAKQTPNQLIRDELVINNPNMVIRLNY